ncbi:MAG: histidine kinase N-terminal 7TM domain-containing protein [Anaerolineales bacterium]
MVSIINFLVAASDILSAGIAITAFSLLLYSLTFNLRDRVARVFAALLLFVTIVYFCDAVVSTISGPAVDTWLRLQWIGIAFIPVAYLHFSDALLATTGRPSRWRRRLAIRLLYLVGGAFLLAATLGDLLVNRPVIDSGAAHLRAGPLFPVFILYFIGSLAAAAWNFLRAYRGTQSSTARRRMLYLMTSAAAPALGAFPFLLLSGQAAALHPLIFWSIALLTNLAVTVLLVVMAYAVAYYGVTQPDRVVKSRLFQWLLRGPVVASTVLTVYVLVNRLGPAVPGYDARVLPILLVATLLVLQYGINLVRLPIERVLFYGADSGELRRLQILQDRLLTSDDLQQFLESVLASLCDSLTSPAGFIAAFSDDGKLEYEVSLGVEAATRSPHELPPYSALRSTDAGQAANNGAHPNGHPAARPEGGLFEWGPYRIMPLRGQSQEEPLGLLGWLARPEALTDEEVTIVETLSGRAAAALEDRRLQRDVFQAVDRLLPQIEEIQRLRASANASGTQPLAAGDDSLLRSADLPAIIKNALSDYWGGPKLTGSPLLRLRVVEEALRDHNGDAANALRAVLKQAIERIKPDGQRKFTAEWILYNILEMKFLEGRRVREVALRLAVSEADLYRKQRAAVEQLARAIVVMEQEAAERASDYEVAG